VHAGHRKEIVVYASTICKNGHKIPSVHQREGIELRCGRVRILNS
jgi:hypothetical protein